MNTPDAEALLEEINGWAAIESKSEELQGVTRMMERAMADFEAAGMLVEPIAGTEGLGPHFHARTPCGREGPSVLVLCHLDTVHPAGSLRRNPIRTEGDRAFGPGVYDMKGGVVLALAAARSLIGANVRTPLPIRFLVVSDEEIGSPTSQPHIRAAAANAAHVLVTEPARDGGKVVTARKGAARMKIAAQGKPAHSGVRHQDGESAVLEMARQIVDLEAMTRYETGLTLNVGLVHGGSGVNVVPEHCEAELDIRMTDLAEGEAAIARIRGIRPYNPEIRLTVSGGMNRPPYAKSNSVAALFEHARGLAAEIGFELHDTFTGGGSDGNFTASIAPTLDGLGVDGAGAHTMEEHLLVSSLVPRMLLLRRLFETLKA
ncbi:MAG: M20 family metallopeptidase [Pikeienuella sp.]|uniref:M20 family metallopeptidase n=1 Tax=Pikeienuella sp. TaxID=2831957 RepID=UPI00391960A0